MRFWKVSAWIFQLHFSNFTSNFSTYRFFQLLFPTTRIPAIRLNKTPSVSGSGPEIENFQRTVKIFRLDDETVKRIWHLRFELKWLILFYPRSLVCPCAWTVFVWASVPRGMIPLEASSSIKFKKFTKQSWNKWFLEKSKKLFQRYFLKCLNSQGMGLES